MAGTHAPRGVDPSSRAFVAAGAVLLAVLGPVASAAPVAAAGGGGVPDEPQRPTLSRELVVRVEAGEEPAAVRELRAQVGAEVSRELRLPGAEVWQLPVGLSSSAVEARVEALPGVEWAEPAVDFSLAANPGDPLLGSQWALENSGQAVGGVAGLPDADIDAFSAWDSAQGLGAVVAVIDSGVQVSHPDLAPNLWANPGESGAGREANGVDDDGNGLVDDLYGWDFVADSDGVGNPEPGHGVGHGTHVAGIVAARSGNGVGVSGVAPRAALMSLDAYDSTTSSLPDYALADAIIYARDRGARIVNLSLVGGVSQVLSDAVAASPGMLFVAAAGNSAISVDAVPSYPCALPFAQVVCVAATDSLDRLAAYSNYGVAQVDLAAPGSTILSTYPSGAYAYLTGTSMAAPHVAGAAALALSAQPGLSVAQLKGVLLSSVDPLPTLQGRVASGGRLNAARVVASALAVNRFDPRTAPLAEVRAFVEQLYQVFLGRSPDPGGWDGWTAALRSGSLDRTQVALGFARSIEYATTYVNRAYLDVLGRPADPGGLIAWRDAIVRGSIDEAGVKVALLASEEFYAGAGRDVTTWVARMYARILGRSPDAGGLAAWVNVAVSQGRSAAAVGVVQSTESAFRRVAALYQSVLGRAPDPGGQASWAPVIVTQGDIVLAASLAGSPEFFLRAQQV